MNYTDCDGSQADQFGSRPHGVYKMKIYKSTYLAPYCPTNLSIPQFLTQYNPDAVSSDKIILEDDWTGCKATYAGFRDTASRHAFRLREEFGLGVEDVIAISAPNSVCILT